MEINTSTTDNEWLPLEVRACCIVMGLNVLVEALGREGGLAHTKCAPGEFLL